MALIGNTVVQLYDAKTGEMTDKVEKKNLVTNAVSNVLNGALNPIVACLNNGIGEHRYMNCLYKLPSGYNIAKALFGGVLIFSKSIQSDVDHCIPTVDEMKSFVGCANQSAGIAGNIFRGSINAAESKIGANYVKFVWDFTTEQCNGDIASICLTSDIGGCQGYKFSAKTNVNQAHFLSWLYNNMWDVNTKSEFNSSYIHNPMFKSSFTNSNAHGSYIYDNYLYYVYRDKVYKYNIEKLLNKYGSDILSSFDYGKVTTYDEVITLTDYSYSVINCLDDDSVYEYDSSIRSNEKFDLIKVSKNAVTTKVSIPTANIIASISEYLNYSCYAGLYHFAGWSCVYKDKIYTLVGWINNSDLVTMPNKLRIYILSFDGSFTFKDISLTDNMISMLFGAKTYKSLTTDPGTRFSRIFDNLVLSSSDGTNGYAYYFVSDDGDVDTYPFMSTDTQLAYYGNILYKNSGWLKEPWCSFKFAGNGMLNTVELLAPYLATINNQDVALTKTADKTMKIIYTLTQE